MLTRVVRGTELATVEIRNSEINDKSLKGGVVRGTELAIVDTEGESSDSLNVTRRRGSDVSEHSSKVHSEGDSTKFVSTNSDGERKFSIARRKETREKDIGEEKGEIGDYKDERNSNNKSLYIVGRQGEKITEKCGIGEIEPEGEKDTEKIGRGKSKRDVERVTEKSGLGQQIK